MTEQDHNNLSAGDEQTTRENNDEFIPEDAWPLCPNCLKPCNPLQNYCENCGSNDVINPLASYMPFVRIRFNYGGFCTMWQKIWYDEDISMKCRLFYLFMIIAFAPIMLVLGLPFSLTGKIRNAQLRKMAIIILYVLAFVLLMFLYSFSRF